jgi:hypothetical protein
MLHPCHVVAPTGELRQRYTVFRDLRTPRAEARDCALLAWARSGLPCRVHAAVVDSALIRAARRNARRVLN